MEKGNEAPDIYPQVSGLLECPRDVKERLNYSLQCINNVLFPDC